MKNLNETNRIQPTIVAAGMTQDEIERDQGQGQQREDWPLKLRPIDPKTVSRPGVAPKGSR